MTRARTARILRARRPPGRGDHGRCRATPRYKAAPTFRARKGSRYGDEPDRRGTSTFPGGPSCLIDPLHHVRSQCNSGEHPDQ
jgi:hypothetical protein